MSRRLSAAAERNKQPILKRAAPVLRNASNVLEIGSGSGQHAEYLAARMPWLRWTCSDVPERLPELVAMVQDAGLPNLGEPLALDVREPWPALRIDAVYTANTLHIMDWPTVELFFEQLGGLLAPAARLLVYGPFHYASVPTSESNAAFDRMLREENSGKGIRDIEAVQSLAAGAGLRLLGDFAMPANNRLLAWEKSDA